MSDELGADARLVAFMQYLRVLIVVVTAPLVATVLFGAGGDAGRARARAAPASPRTSRSRPAAASPAC